ncbi:MAG: DUF1444 family protein [Phycisphaeraceae bacterium]|nr:DUF1444 family protein [Phycisphaerae bacterium]MBX3391132.1 DUF1444 family protein [Phycisphaeraceae bacterium]HRJ49538.1 DUF1444 family protein [Phycisphaerales bacterium]
MAGMPREPEAFAEAVAQMLRKGQPSYSVQLIGPRELLVNGRRLDLDNLHRMVNHEPSRGQEIVGHYLDQLFAGDAFQSLCSSLDFARPRIMPRIQPQRIFEHLSREMVAHVPFVNDTVIVFVTDLPQMTVSITTEQCLQWNLCFDELDLIARENLDRYSPELAIQFVESKEGGRAAIVCEHDGYDAARLLLTDLHRRLAPRMGGDFFVATPARDMFVAMSHGPEPFLGRLRDRVLQDFKRLPYPISAELFLVTRDGIAGTEPINGQEAA